MRKENVVDIFMNINKLIKVCNNTVSNLNNTLFFNLKFQYLNLIRDNKYTLSIT